MTTEQTYRRIQERMGGMFGNGHRHSLPMPIQTGSRFTLSIFLAPQVVAGTGTHVYPPSHVADFDIESGELIELRAVSPAAFGRSDPAQEVLGMVTIPEGITFDEFMRMRGELFAAYDRLVPAFVRGRRRLSGEDASAAEIFRARFPILREAPLEAYYAHFGHDFLAWLERASSTRR